MPTAPIYLDHNGTTPVAPEVAEAMWPFLTEHFGNPSSATPYGKQARNAIEHAREQVATLIGAHPDEITFTSGGTESNNLAIRGSVRAILGEHRFAVTSAVEHPATAQPLVLLEAEGWTVHRLPVDHDGRVTAAAVPAGPIGLGTMILAQNETGTIQPVPEVAERVHAAGGVMHTDGAQAVGKIPVSVNELGADLLSLAGHKLYAPKGVGALFVRRGTTIRPLLVGAGQERGLRPGTENVAGIVGLGKAAQLALDVLDTEPERQLTLREALWCQLARGIPGLVRVSPAEGCLPNTLMVALPGRSGADLLEATPTIAASTGSACHSGVPTPAATLLAMGIEPDLALGALRLTVGRSTTHLQVHAAATAIVQSWRESSSAGPRGGVDALLAAARAGVHRPGPQEMLAALERGALVIDTRTDAQRAEQGELPGALVIDRTVLEWRLDPHSVSRIPEAVGYDVEVIVVCSQGYSSSLAAASLRALGLWRATDLAGGYAAYLKAGFPPGDQAADVRR